MSKTKELTPEELAASYEAANEQSRAQIVALEARVKELAGYQKEAVDSRDAIASLQANLAGATNAAESATRELGAARAELKAATSARAAKNDEVAAARQLVVALKRLS